MDCITDYRAGWAKSLESISNDQAPYAITVIALPIGPDTPALTREMLNTLSNEEFNELYRLFLISGQHRLRCLRDAITVDIKLGWDESVLRNEVTEKEVFDHPSAFWLAQIYTSGMYHYSFDCA